MRQQQRDVRLVLEAIQDLNERQTQLFLLTTAAIVNYRPPELQHLLDADVAAAADSMAATFETASRGVIYEHRPPSAASERLSQALRPLFERAGQNQGSAFERDAAIVLRRLALLTSEVQTRNPGDPRAFLTFVARVMKADQPGDFHIPGIGKASDDELGTTDRSRALILP
ncbi:MAG TPA: hypothetical protein VJP86_17610 [Vicinamibacterales bacterium]|nr:hypothetical protein [Vicinamibacterales bacterium]